MHLPNMGRKGGKMKGNYCPQWGAAPVGFPEKERKKKNGEKKERKK